ncbi:XRE family transcriptional regulator [Flavobacterium sp. TN-1]
METIAQKINHRVPTPYQVIARKYNTCEMYVGQIARGERIPKRGKGLNIKQELEKLIQNENTKENC